MICVSKLVVIFYFQEIYKIYLNLTGTTLAFPLKIIFKACEIRVSWLTLHHIIKTSEFHYIC